ncbi:DNA translocase FtsK 4TM domain-containing protein [Blattabacterium sp. (Blaberus giganteus)]|uniref:DNA translocase FtsK 4TM domain-containing protein n=1 Tax=Blattabacterium sp. (Blaberus giganteus) TaxID=1186051 RepID=UPI00025F6F3D|nr:DNA translocase FtsK 4TM domain-containing protein [Blattabacterium sp. (Blaberus giganteus)]AFJ90754.1 cell division protein [Blattabacterium sp. (Blaberus giganteus)]
MNKDKIKKKEKKILKTIFGFFLLGNSIFLFLSFFSFLFHWKNDQSQIEKLFDKEIIAENLLGKMGATVSHYFIHCGIGVSAFFIPVLLFFTGLKILFMNQKLLNNFYKSTIYKLLFFSIWLPIFFYVMIPDQGIFSGIFGFEIGNYLIHLFGKVGLYMLLLTSIIFYLIIIFRISAPTIRNDIKKKIQNINQKIDTRLNTIYQLEMASSFSQEKNFLHSILFSRKKEDFSSIDLKTDLESNKKKIVQILNCYNIEIYEIKASIGPTIILYEIFPKVGTRISKIKNLKNEIALNLSAISIRIIAPIPGKKSIGIEIPNHHRYPVYMKDILFSEESNKKSHKMELPISLGKTVFNEIFIVDLAKMPHLLIAGSTGQGKSVGLNVMIIFLLYKKNSKDIKFILIDPKKVELSIYKKISKSYFATLPNSIEPIITDLHEVKNILNSLCKEMDKRYAILEKHKVRNIQEYNKYNKYNLPYIILIIDEFADLNIYNNQKKQIETYITRLAQLARAVGIHLIIATQRPSVDVITGLIKSNFTARIAFKVSSKIDSRTILDCTGAEQLIGKGDLLFSNKNELIRLQCPFMELSDIRKIVDFYGKKNKKNEYFFLPEPDIMNE